ncbi:MAG: RluA family pseudouridine synthase [Oscillospiraceae bacterium]|jgi:23S rRNA pseudouridine1911/1915/1917 synthase|nr:RluA family pseudouridine synthase [Oscillospiraceae bacterium]
MTTARMRFESERDGVRLDALLPELLPGCSRSAAARLISEGRVTKGGAPVSKSCRVSRGDVFDVELPEPETPYIEAQDIPLDVVFEDGDVIVVNKPRGMVVHPSPGHRDGTLVNALLGRCGDSLSGIGGFRRPGIVHRIDKDTSGLIIAAKNDAAHLALSRQLRERTLGRVYETVVHGVVKDDSGTVDAPIGRHPSDRKRQAVVTRGGAARSAVTRYEVVERYARHTRLRCRLETGRTHQIRVHMAYIGRPVLGDRVYGHRRPELGLHGQCLHARELCFVHPATGAPVSLTTELPEYFVEILRKLAGGGGFSV